MWRISFDRRIPLYMRKKVYFYRQNQEEIENYDQSNGLFWLRWISTHFETFFPPFILHVQCLWVYCHFGYFNSAWQQLFEIMSAVYSICWSNVICAASPFNVIYAWSELADEKSDENVLYLWFMTKFFDIALCEAIKWAFFAISFYGLIRLYAVPSTHHRNHPPTPTIPTQEFRVMI